MKSIRVDIKVKFRAAGITFGQVKQGFVVTLEGKQVSVVKVSFQEIGKPAWSKSGVSVWFS